MNSVVLNLGETRHIRLEVRNTEGEDFKISKCDYEFISPCNIVEAKGNADILNHILDVVLTPQAKGEYDLKYIYYIADEILVEHVRVSVI